MTRHRAGLLTVVFLASSCLYRPAKVVATPVSGEVKLGRATAVVDDGADRAPVIVTVRDAHKRPVAGVVIQVDATDPGIVDAPSAPTDENGEAIAWVTCDSPGDVTVSAIVDPKGMDVKLDDHPVVTFVDSRAETIQYEPQPPAPTSGMHSGSAGPMSLAVADFDGDGNLDVAVANAYSPASISVLQGDGTGVLSMLHESTTGVVAPSELAAGDLDNDGLVDLVVEGSESSARVAEILRGDGTGNFGDTPVLLTGNILAVALADLDADGHVDLAYTISDPPDLVVQLNSGVVDALPDAWGTPLTDYGVCSGPGSLALQPPNGSEPWTAAVACSTVGTIDAVTGDGTPAPLSWMSSTGPKPAAVAMADFDGNGTTDYVYADGTASSLSVLLMGPASLTADSVVKLTLAVVAGGILAVDANGDGNPDVVATLQGKDEVAIFLGDGAGAFDAPIIESLVAGCSPRPIAAGDFDNNGVLDLAVACHGNGSTVESSVVLLLGH